MWQKASFLTKLVASSVNVSESAGSLIKKIMSSGNLKIISKCNNCDLQTEADRAAQYFIEQSLQQKFQSKLRIIGEEENVSKTPYIDVSVSNEVLKYDNRIPEEFKNIREEDVVIWVDPLDGTFEFASCNGKTANLQPVTVLIGIAYKGRPIAGIIHQPYFTELTGRTLWGIVGLGVFGRQITPPVFEKVAVTTKCQSTELGHTALQSLEEKQLVNRVERLSGAGYKAIKCLEGAAAYVFANNGCKKWDTAAPEALLLSAGGNLTDISGRKIDYSEGVQISNTGGVLATANWVKHQDYVDAIPQQVKVQLPEMAISCQDIGNSNKVSNCFTRVFGRQITPPVFEKVAVTTKCQSTELGHTALQSLEEKQLVNRVERLSGAGYKAIKCLEGAAAYVFANNGCKKWDTAAPEALLLSAGGNLTDISGRKIDYSEGVQISNTGGVLATANWVKHQDYVDAIPQQVKVQLPEMAISCQDIGNSNKLSNCFTSLK
uniref:3'(2'),5'-bisphosphate nucleotidase n=1 Tax=Panagrolaimus sp. JU765 TaxID=591449 RepID=A0AC34Q2V8_9BILA